MNKRFVTVLVVAFLIAGGCAFLVYRVLGARLGAAPKPQATTHVLGAANDIHVGTVLADANLAVIELAGSAPKGSFPESEKKNLIGRGVISDLYQGEPIMENRLAPQGSGGGLAAMIPQGMRACAVKVDEVVGVAGFVTPGQRVDVLMSGIPPDANQPNSPYANLGPQVRTVLQNIQVLSAGKNIQKDAEGKPEEVQVVNLLVTPDQAETLTLASSNTTVKVQLVLRNPLDTKTDPVQGSAMNNIFTPGAPPVAQAQKPVRQAVRQPHRQGSLMPMQVEVINGTTRTQEKFSTPEGKK